MPKCVSPAGDFAVGEGSGRFGRFVGRPLLPADAVRTISAYQRSLSIGGLAGAWPPVASDGRC